MRVILNYQRASSKTKRSTKWLAAIAVAVIAFAPLFVDRQALIQWGHVVRWIHVSYLAHQCATYKASPQTIAYVRTDVTRPLALETLGAGSFGSFGPDSPFQTPDSFVQPLSRWRDFIQELNPSAKPESTLFLHERTSSFGHKRIVAIGIQYLPEIISTIIVPGDGLKSPTLFRRTLADVESTASDSLQHAAFLRPGLRFFEGKADPDDPARFTIPCELAGKAVLLDGWLHGQYDQVSIKMRDSSEVEAYVKRMEDEKLIDAVRMMRR